MNNLGISLVEVVGQSLYKYVNTFQHCYGEVNNLGISLVEVVGQSLYKYVNTFQHCYGEVNNLGISLVEVVGQIFIQIRKYIPTLLWRSEQFGY